jgi:acetyl-CoA carboxylase carboxyltransferase component
LAQIEASSLKKAVKSSMKKEKALLTRKARYDEQVSPYYAASRLWTDAIIDPLDTRTWISMGHRSGEPLLLRKNLTCVIQV